MPLPGGAQVMPALGPDYPLGPGDEGYDPLADLWSRVARPCDVVATVATLTGLDRAGAGELVGTAVAASHEAAELLRELPRSIRALATAVDAQPERCIGELRGPVLWSETLSARASSFGDPDLFVCATPARAHDIDQNRVLVAALVAVRDAAEAAAEHTAGDRRRDADAVRIALHNGNEAARFLEHPSLVQVRRGRPTPREVKRTRSGKKRSTYGPALALLDRAAEPLGLEELRAACDDRTRAQHAVLATVMARLEADTDSRLPPLRAERGALWAGPVQYHHPRHADPRRGPVGIVVGDVAIDVPDPLDGGPGAGAAALAARWPVGPSRVVVQAADVYAAVDLAAARARRAGAGR